MNAIQRFGLAVAYSENDEIQKVVRRTSALPIVPLDKIEDVWADRVADSP